MERTLQITTQPQTQPMLVPWFLPQARLVWYSRVFALETLAAEFSPISLAQMDAVALLDRVDAKFVMTQEQLLCALAALKKDYWLLAVEGQRLNHYRTLYFDTPDFVLYNAHVNGQAERYKVRSREYTDSHLSFIEVKHKTRKDRTIKSRIPTAEPVTQINAEFDTWLQGVSPLAGSQVEAKILNTFTRITLVSKTCCERVTLDVDLAFTTAERVVQLDNLAVAEVKMDTGNLASPFFAQMRAQKIRQHSFSKYAVGVCLLHEQVKKNTLKPTLLLVNQLMKGTAQ
jgi:hypothetical protein